MSSLSSIPTKTTPRQMMESLRVIKQAWDRMRYGQQEYREYGLLHDDLYSERHPDVVEAVRRLPEELYDGRIHRQHRAMQLSRNKIILPQALWTKQEDKNHFYMKPYLEEVEKEHAEKAEWDKK